MSRIIKGWRCDACGGKVRITQAKEKVRRQVIGSHRTKVTKQAVPGRWNFIYCNYDPCLNSPSKGGGDRMSDINFMQGHSPNWVIKA